jgi:hypothetical protein
MKYTYKVIENAIYGTTTIERTDESGNVAWIPKDPANSDYQRYLNPEAEHFTPSLPE